MSLQDRAKPIIQAIEGKTPKAISDLTDAPKDQAEDKARQAEEKARHIIENLRVALFGKG